MSTTRKPVAIESFPLGPKYNEYGEIRFMVRSGGYVMVRRPGRIPFVLHEKEWKKLSDTPVPRRGEGG